MTKDSRSNPLTNCTILGPLKMLCVVVLGRGDVKCLEDSCLNAGSVCGRASVEVEVTIPGHYGILKGDGGRINRIVRRFVSKMLMRVVPGARGARTYLAVVGSLRD